VFKSLWNVVKDDLDEVPQVLIDRKLQFTDDEEFARGIREHRLYRVKATHRKYVLAEYETSFPGDKSYPLPDDITTDHLLPQGVDPLVWGSVSQEDRDSLVDTWANLVPLSQDAQNQKGAKNWVDQRKLMVDRQGTVYKSTREVFDLWPNEWTAETLRERADYLVDWALMRWPREIPSTS